MKQGRDKLLLTIFDSPSAYMNGVYFVEHVQRREASRGHFSGLRRGLATWTRVTPVVTEGARDLGWL